jgi:hypothetical protein
VPLERVILVQQEKREILGLLENMVQRERKVK